MGLPAAAAAPARPWYSPAPDPELPPISAKRAYGEVLFVFGAFFAVGIAAAALLLAGRSQDLTTTGSWGLYGTQCVDIVFEIGLAVLVVWLLAQRRGVSLDALGLHWPRRADGRFDPAATTRVLAWAMVAQIVGGVINDLLRTGSLPHQQTSAPALVFSVFDSVQAGIVEELVVLGFVVVTLRQARRPWWEVTAVALVLRGSYHIYYGPGVFGILVWAVLFYWIYLRTRTLLPLMVAHAGWDAVAFLGQRWSAVAAVALLITVALWIAAPITWLAGRSHPPDGGYQPASSGWAGGSGGSGPTNGYWPGPGWHPDPSGLNQWRWWDGQRWTGHVSGHDPTQPERR